MLSRALSASHRRCALSCTSRGNLTRSNCINSLGNVGVDLVTGEGMQPQAGSSREISSFLCRDGRVLGTLENYSSLLSTQKSEAFKQNHQLQQVRHMGRRDGYSKFNEERKPTKKQRKAYNRRKALERREKEKHGAPGSKAAAIKDWVEDHVDMFKKEAKGELLALEDDPEFNRYTRGHALIEDLMGNTAHLTSTETPRISDDSRHYGRQYHRVKTLIRSGKKPTDEDLNLLIRSFRDKYGGQRFYTADDGILPVSGNNKQQSSSRKKPVGVAKALHLLTKNLGIPASQLEPRTLAAVMTCASRPIEARKVLDKMIERKMPLEYAYSILIDLYAKRGDFVEARLAMDEMSSVHGIQPSVVAYTSLIAACHRAASPPTTPYSIKEHAQEEAWKAWTEMRIIGVEADAMAYGAIIRFYAMRGQAEKCIDFINEMYRFQVRPTTLIFTSALHGVAQSHRVSLRFEGGKSRKDYRAQWIAAHHGKMVRQIIIKAEQAEVEQDDGFVAALLLCAGTAGDSATAKAILLASEIRRKDWLRPIGSKEYLEKHLQPPGQNLIDKPLMESDENQGSMQIGNGDVVGEMQEELTKDLDTAENSEQNELKSVFLEGNPEVRNKMLEKDPKLKALLEHNNPFPLENPFLADKRDDRALGRIPPQVHNEPQVLRCLLEACAQSMEAGGLGNLWGGPKNKGFLCEQTLKAITTRQVPRYVDNSVPGISGMEFGLGGVHFEEEDVDTMSKRLRRSKWMGFKDADPNAYGTNLDEIDPDLAAMFDKERKRRDELLYGTDEPNFDDYEEEPKNFDHKFTNEGLYFEDEKKDPESIEGLSKTLDASFVEKLSDSEKNDNNEIDENLDEAEALSEEDLLEEEAYGAATETDFGEEADEEEEKWTPTSREQALVRSQMDLVTEHREKYALDDFALAMPPGLPAHRIEKLRNVFQSNLGYPSMLELVPLLRENMPDRPRLSWLKKKNLQNAHFVMKRMEDLNMLNNTRSLNKILQVTAASGKLNKALSFHAVEFERRGVSPDQRSDRMVVEMLLKSKRLSRALEFKDGVENAGRELDRHGYGAFVKYHADQQEIGSALLTVKECLAVHGFPPNEVALKKVRALCRRKGLLQQTQLESLIGPDPFQYIREGMLKKRSRKRKDNRFINKIHNMIIQ